MILFGLFSFAAMNNLIIHFGDEMEVYGATSLAGLVKQSFPSDSVWHLASESQADLLKIFAEIDHVIVWKNDQSLFANLKRINKLLGGEEFRFIFKCDNSKRGGMIAFKAKAIEKFGFQQTPLSGFIKNKIDRKALPARLNILELYQMMFLGKVGDIQLPKVKVKDSVETKVRDIDPYIVLAPFEQEKRRNSNYSVWEKIIARIPLRIRIYIIADQKFIKEANSLQANRENVKIFQTNNYDEIIPLIQNAKFIIAAQNIFALLSASFNRSLSIIANQRIYRSSYDILPDQTFIYSTQQLDDIVLKALPAKKLKQISDQIFSKEVQIDYAVETIISGGIIIQNTDTIPGLSASAVSEKAVDRLYRIKERDPSKAMLILCSDMRMAKDYVSKVPEIIFEILDKSKEDPLTIIYPFGKNLPENLLARDSSIGIRIPKNKELVEFIRRVGNPIVSTSANISGGPAPEKLSEVSDEVLNKVDIILDYPDAHLNIPKPSSIIKIKYDGVEVIREGEMNLDLKEFLKNL